MIVPLTAVFAALAIGLPIFALGERIREREERRLNLPPNSPPRKVIPGAGTEHSPESPEIRAP